MPQREYVPRAYGLDSLTSCPRGIALSPQSLSLRSKDPDQGYRFTFEALRRNMFRTTFSSASHPLPPYPSAKYPHIDLDEVHTSSSGTTTQREFRMGKTKAVVDWADAPVIELFLKGSDSPVYRDLNFRSYAVDSSGIAHYSEYKRNTLHVGLGEKAAPMNLSNRQFTLSATDCFGYDVYRTDPMYKHIPLLINITPNGCVATFSTSASRGTYSVGSEIDGLWGHYKVYRQDYGGLEEYILVGDTVEEVIQTYADLVGYPRLVPRWALGYIAGGMKYSMLDEPRACDSLMEFAAKMKENDIPCSAFQMSSGYTVAETQPKTRNVFTWNRHRFPDPEGFIAQYHAEGIRLIANVKPYVLSNHPEYKRLSDAGALFRDPRTSKTAVTRLWSAGGGESGEGSHIDFTSTAGFKWWYDGVQALRKCGIIGIWNDNNEYTISDDDWQCSLEDAAPKTVEKGKHIGLWGRSMHTELMGKASHDALVDLEPNIRPYVLTRSATAGTMRYAASSWSGDNVTSWEGMKGANALSLNAGMSLLQSYGHDIGGFEGPQPSPELLLRWVQQGIYSPRFAINCFKTSPENNLVGDVIEPWMYPEITPLIRATVKRRYELIPYIYSLMLESHMTAKPAQRWIGWGYESDSEVWASRVMAGEEQYWFGETLMVGGVYEPGKTTGKLYLPKKADHCLDDGFVNLNSPHQYISSGQWVEIESEWTTSIPVLAKVGGAIPVGKDVQTRSLGEKDPAFSHLPDDDWRGVEIFPSQGISEGVKWSNTWYEDDGISAIPDIQAFTIEYECSDTEVTVKVTKDLANKLEPLWKTISIILPVGDKRVVVSENGTSVTNRDLDRNGRRVFDVHLA